MAGTAKGVRVCGRCGAELSGYAPEGLCAVCLLESAFARHLGVDTDDLADDSPAPIRFGDYELLEEIARGGMGVVYRARQVSLNRAVAVKMILAGRLAGEVETARFRTEAETAARLQHPGIVAIHGIGEHEGSQYFSMDYVAGRTLAEVAREHPLPAQRAARYTRCIAEAIHYAHEQGVIHRDLKPSNVLIDAQDQPRVTDFGLAKWLEGKSDLTLAGQVLGSPSFMSPEQANSGGRALGPASDVYSLGAILYYLLSGRPPFVAETATATLRMVADMEPVALRLLNASVPRDLETICLKCLQKDPARRYATASELASDLDRFLRDEPIKARAVGHAERAWRWCRRKPALSAAICLLVVVAVGSPIAVVLVNRERVRAVANERKFQAMAKFLADTLQSAGPTVTQGRDATVLKELLVKAAQRVGTELGGEPEAEADVRLIIGQTYEDLGDYTNALAMTSEALRLRKAVFGPKHLSVAHALNNMGAIWAELGNPEKAEAYDREALAVKRELLGSNHLDVALSLNNLGFRLWNRNDFTGAEAMHREALDIRTKALPPNHPDIAASLNNLAMVLWVRGEFDEAEGLFQRALLIFRAEGDQKKIAIMLNNIATVLRDLGRLEEAKEMNREALEMRQRVLGRHGYTGYSMNNLAIVLQRLGELEAAERLHREGRQILEERLTTNHQYVAESLCGLGIVLARKGDFTGAEGLQRGALATYERALGKDKMESLDCLNALAILRASQGDLTESETLLARAVAATETLAGRDHPDLVPSLRHLAWVLTQNGRQTEGEELAQRAKTIAFKHGDYGLRALTESTYDLADLLHVQQRFADAEPLLHDAADLIESQGGAQHFKSALARRFVDFYEAWDRCAPGTGKLQQAATWRMSDSPR